MHNIWRTTKHLRTSMHDSGKPVPDSGSNLDDIPTVSALAVIAVCITTTAHEALGHGSACWAVGGHIAQLTSVLSMFRA
jgi:hypothetical protein